MGHRPAHGLAPDNQYVERPDSVSSVPVYLSSSLASSIDDIAVGHPE